jgi:hypothetical protein
MPGNPAAETKPRSRGHCPQFRADRAALREQSNPLALTLLGGSELKPHAGLRTCSRTNGGHSNRPPGSPRRPCP